MYLFNAHVDLILAIFCYIYIYMSIQSAMCMKKNACSVHILARSLSLKIISTFKEARAV